ncbi:MAG: DUF47 domain-containing protein [Slackia sp.]
MERAHEIEHAADKVCHSIFQAVSVDFITPIDREDIISLTQSMDDILDYMEATIQRFYMFNLTSMHPRAIDFARLLLKSCEALKVAMGNSGTLRIQEASCPYREGGRCRGDGQPLFHGDARSV